MEFSFRENQAYLLAKNVYRLILLHTQKENFKKNENLTRRIEKTSLCVISLIIANLTSRSDEEKSKSLSKLLHLANSIYSLYDVAMDLGLIDKKDLSLMESALNELLLEIKKL
ncbi:MAG: hypothetical protein WC788_09815 [Candidatus Paceibacterota bacterium]|jgi:hypothetical protein